ncbi:MAG: prepilin-type N-terminal cleavage/methylation domain-containing protein [Deltaproteobacteria bacterium]|nr:prepilin-type N-terminal cleavage/methylation domain-containing protein [Deltaproteobacteria bacterium]
MNKHLKQQIWRNNTNTRGMTLIEMMISLAVTMFFISGIILFLISHTRTSRRTFDRTDIQRGGRAALSIISQEINHAGLGLPRVFAIRSFTLNGSECSGTPELEIASLDYLREWIVSSTAANSLTLTSANPDPASVSDIIIAQNEWLFFYQNSNFSSGAISNGYGMLQVATTRTVANTAINISNTNYSSLAPRIDLTQPTLSTSVPHVPVILRARVSRFGVNCTDDVAHPYIFWEQAGQNKVPLARNADTRVLAAADLSIGANAGSIAALRFLFYLDANGDGQCDDTNNDNLFTRADAITSPTANDFANVCAIEVQMRLRSETPEAGSNPPIYPSTDFVELVKTNSINTQNPTYIFIDNSGL